MTAVFSRFWIILGFLFWIGLAHAQQEPLMGSEASPALPVPAIEDSPVIGGAEVVSRILVIGDGLAGGLGAGMTRMVQDDPRFEIVNRFNESSGLSRVEVYDWPNAIAKIVADKPVDAVVVLLGVNDRQDIRNGNIRYPFKSPDWVSGYRANVGRLLEAATSANAKVFWVSIPPMADAVFDAEMRYLSDIHEQEVIKRGGHFVDVRTYFAGPDGQFVERGPDETGLERKLRASDGINFFKQGNNRFGQLVLADIDRILSGKTIVAEKTPTVIPSNIASSETTLPAVATPAAPVATGSPSFGQEGLEGEQITFRADAIVPATSTAQPTVTAAGPATVPSLSEIRLTAKAGSAAAKLFGEGQISGAPEGRFDDFAVP